MRILQTITLSSLLLLIISSGYPLKNKNLRAFSHEGYTFDRNQVQCNQPKYFISYVYSAGKNETYLGCLFTKKCEKNTKIKIDPKQPETDKIFILPELNKSNTIHIIG